jgi:hypothetical protein
MFHGAIIAFGGPGRTAIGYGPVGRDKTEPSSIVAPPIV